MKCQSHCRGTAFDVGKGYASKLPWGEEETWFINGRTIYYQSFVMECQNCCGGYFLVAFDVGKDMPQISQCRVKCGHADREKHGLMRPLHFPSLLLWKGKSL